MPGPTPYIVQPGDILYGYNIGDGNQGPFEHGGATYVLALVTDAVTRTPVRTGVFKSTDSGATFTEMDSGNAPLSPPGEYTTSCFYPATGGSVLYILAQQGVAFPGANPLGIFSFDMSTDTWTTIATGGPNASDIAPNQLLARTSTGEFVAFYNFVSGTTYNVYAVTCSSGGAWGVPSLLGAASDGVHTANVDLMGISGTDTVVMVWTSNQDGAYYVNTWTSGGGFSSKSVAFPYSTPWNDGRYDLGQGWNAQGKFISAENKVGWCLPLYPTASTIQPTMLIADMSVTPPVFTLVPVASDINAQEDTFWTDFCVSPTGSTLTAMWTWQGTGPGNTPNQVLQSTSALLAGPWAAESVYWDNATDPPVTPPAQNASANIPNFISVRQLSVGVRAITGLFPIQAGQPVYQGSYFLSSPVPVVVVVTCPIGSATLNLPYTGTIVASGGTAPYTYAIIGGSLPIGLTLDPATGIITGIPTLSGLYSFTVQATDANGVTATATCSILIPPVVSTGGRGFVKVVVNHFDSCLGREYLLYQLINRELLKCGVKPFCFCISERDWGGNFSEHEEVPMGPPEGAIAFNPTGQLVLPTAASGDNVIFQTRVPIGYDGVILGQYHGYIPDPTAMPVPFFVQGGGDIVWRLEAAGRCVRDCGIMKVSLGSLQNMTPVSGGLQVRSGNLIQYVVTVPNTSGALTPGVGNIVAGLHGWYWPRK